ncbi:MAG: hypothetical protein DI539_25590 [Flavobacterium psychrophilum]|nr:MAG: hypothetical protein DI539_25590 [Flavobacterium psychrophilum]
MAVLSIMESPPSTWEELQDFVSLILTDCGYETKVEETVATARGRVNVDVFARLQGPYVSTIFCECKYWSNPIPQTVIHSFRTVINDYGANQGIIISKIGFQSGAYEAIKNSNVQLLTWEEFQDNFRTTFIHNVIRRNHKVGRMLMSSANIVIDYTVSHPTVLSQEEFSGFQNRRERYRDYLLFSTESAYSELDTGQVTMSEVDKVLPSYIRDIGVRISCLRDYFNVIHTYCVKELGENNELIKVIQKRIADGTV